jgi:hypothetical protein
MDAVHDRQDRPALVKGLLVLGVVAMLMLAGAVGYVMKGSALPTTPHAASVAAPTTGVSGAVNVLPYREHYSGDVSAVATSGAAGAAESSDSKSGYASGLGVTTSVVSSGLNADSTSGYAGTR